MLTNITWANYIIGVVLLLALYYCFIGIRYYSSDLKEIIAGKKKFSFLHLQRNKVNDTIHITYPNTLNADDSLSDALENPFHEIGQLTEKLGAAIADSADKKLVKGELFFRLQLILKENASIKNSPLQATITELIASECSKYGFIAFNEEERTMLWK